MSNHVPVLLVTGFGLNCEAESRHAWELAGAQPTLMHLNDLLEKPERLHDFAAFMIGGGFSYGDHMGSGLVFAHRIRHHMREDLQKFIDAGKLVMGVCNGFQILTKLGLLPALDGNYFDQTVALMHNDCGTFQNFWVTLRFESDSPCVFTRGLTTLELPVRHGQGRLLGAAPPALVPLRYADAGGATEAFPANPNGSPGGAAALCDETGRIFGLMPHPEAFLRPTQHPDWTLRRRRGVGGAGEGLALFRNAVEAARPLSSRS